MDDLNAGGTEVAETTDADFVEIPLDQLGLTDEELQAATHPEGEVAEEVEAPVAEEPAAPEVNPEVLRLQRQLDQLREQTEPLLRMQQQPTDQFAQTLRGLHEKLLNQTMTRQEYAQYLDMREQAQAARLVGTARGEATIAASEAHARGLFNEKDFGKGRSYDQIVGKHITPLYERNPSLRVIEQLVPDQPGQARYLWGAMAELLERSGWDVPRACKTLLGALDAPATAAGEIASRVRRSQASGAAKIHGADTTVGAGKAKITDWNQVPDKTFDRIIANAEIG